jgi:hypothetical protein
MQQGSQPISAHSCCQEWYGNLQVPPPILSLKRLHVLLSGLDCSSESWCAYLAASRTRGNVLVRCDPGLPGYPSPCASAGLPSQAAGTPVRTRGDPQSAFYSILGWDTFYSILGLDAFYSILGSMGGSGVTAAAGPSGWLADIRE